VSPFRGDLFENVVSRSIKGFAIPKQFGPSKLILFSFAIFANSSSALFSPTSLNPAEIIIQEESGEGRLIKE